MPAQDTPTNIIRRILSMCYDCFIVGALLFCAAIPPVLINQDMILADNNTWFQIYLLIVWAAYFILCWCHGGQTIGMKAWRIHIVNLNDNKPTYQQGLLRFIFAFITILLGGIGLWWAFFQPEKKTLYDIWSHTGVRSTVYSLKT